MLGTMTRQVGYPFLMPQSFKLGRLYSRAGGLAFKLWTFPDGQPHFKLEAEDDGDFHEITIEAPIRSLNELGEILRAKDVLSHLG